MIGKLYGVKREARELDPNKRHQLCPDKSQPVIDKLQAWLIKTLPRVAPKTKLGDALHYLDKQWPALVRYPADDRYPIDNNAIENAKGHGIETHAYLRHVFEGLPLDETVDDIHALLPNAVKGGVS